MYERSARRVRMGIGGSADLECTRLRRVEVKREFPPALRSVGMTRLVVVAGMGVCLQVERECTRLRRVEVKREVPPALRSVGMTRLVVVAGTGVCLQVKKSARDCVALR